MKKTIYKSAIIACLFIFCCSLFTATAQEIDAIVTVDTEQLTNEQLQNVENLKNDLEYYINSQSFLTDEWEGPKIPVNITIQLKGTGTNTYSANVFIVSKRSILGDEDGTSVAMKFIDRKWTFEYNRNVSLSYDKNRFDPISSFIDFYMLIIIGLDLDSYGELDGSGAFRIADNILNIASNYNALGWENTMSKREYGRKTLIYELSNARFDEFRRLMFEYYVDGIDMLTSDKEEAIDNIVNTISKMADFKERYVNPSNLLDSFFYTKSNELAELLNGYSKDPKVFRNLMFLDTPNTSLYEAARDGKKR